MTINRMQALEEADRRWPNYSSTHHFNVSQGFIDGAGWVEKYPEDNRHPNLIALDLYPRQEDPDAARVAVARRPGVQQGVVWARAQLEGEQATLEGPEEPLPPEGTRLTTPAQFATYWNTMTADQRSQWIRSQQQTGDIAQRCIVEDHELLAERAKAHSKYGPLLVEVECFVEGGWGSCDVPECQNPRRARLVSSWIEIS